ncbi:pyruvate kinase [Escherichia coli]
MDDIILASDVVMVARGDLGVEIGDPELVGIQKALIRRARQLNRAVITATQMMKSMITNPMPTRAEVMDVANAVLDGTDAVMLLQKLPLGRSVRNCCSHGGAFAWVRKKSRASTFLTPSGRSVRQCGRSYCHVSNVRSLPPERRYGDHYDDRIGSTALMTSRISSGLPIFAMSRDERTLNLTALYRGVTPVHFDSANDGVAAASEAVNLLRDKGYLMSGDLAIVTQGDAMRYRGFY